MLPLAPMSLGELSSGPLVDATLDAIAGPAAVLCRAHDRYVVVRMNGAAEREHGHDPGPIVDGVRRAIEGHDGPWRVTRVVGDARCEVYLAVRPVCRQHPEPRLSDWVRRHRLSPRKASVLGHLSRGESNKEIACALGCAENTVELHVTGLLRATGFTSRTELIARFWTDEA